MTTDKTAIVTVNQPSHSGAVISRLSSQLNKYVHKSMLIILSNDVFTEHHRNVEIKYVHHLQKLYFTLTGEELTS